MNARLEEEDKLWRALSWVPDLQCVWQEKISIFLNSSVKHLEIDNTIFIKLMQHCSFNLEIQMLDTDGRIHFHPTSISSNDTFIQDTFIQKITCGTINTVRVCVKASPAEGRRGLHTNMACARLSGFNKLSCEASPAQGRRCST